MVTLAAGSSGASACCSLLRSRRVRLSAASIPRQAGGPWWSGSTPRERGIAMGLKQGPPHLGRADGALLLPPNFFRARVDWRARSWPRGRTALARLGLLSRILYRYRGPLNACRARRQPRSQQLRGYSFGAVQSWSCSAAAARSISAGVGLPRICPLREGLLGVLRRSAAAVPAIAQVGGTVSRTSMGHRWSDSLGRAAGGLASWPAHAIRPHPLASAPLGAFFRSGSALSAALLRRPPAPTAAVSTLFALVARSRARLCRSSSRARAHGVSPGRQLIGRDLRWRRATAAKPPGHGRVARGASLRGYRGAAR
jgi:hypothetical protein